MSGPARQRSAQDFVTPQAKYVEHAQDMSGVAGAGGQGVAMYPLYGLGQTDAPALPFYSRPLYLVPFGIAVGIGIGYGIWGWFLPNMRKSVRKNMQRGQED